MQAGWDLAFSAHRCQSLGTAWDPTGLAGPGRDRWMLIGILGGFVDRGAGRFLGTRAGLHGPGLQGQGGRLSRPAEL